MATVNIGRKFELDNDTGNNRLIVRALDTGKEWYFNEDGTISNIDDPSSAQDAVNKQYADTTFFDVSGDTVSGNIQMDNNGITNLTDPTNPKDAANKTYVDTTFVDVAGDTMTGSLSMSSNTVSDLATPTQSTDAATKAYVDSTAEGLDVKDAVRVCTCNQGNIDLSSSTDPNPVDTVTLDDGDRILLIEQTDKTENGIYDAVDATDPTTWTRSADADEDDDVNSGLFTLAVEGSVSGNVGFILITPDPITLGTTELDFTRFSGLENIIAGENLSKTGSQIDVVDGPGSGLDADTVDGAELIDLSTAFTQVQAETGSYTAVDGDIVLADASSASITITLPSPSSGNIVSIKKIDSSSNAVIIDTPGSETIDGQASLSISSQYSARTITSDGGDYYII